VRQHIAGCKGYVDAMLCTLDITLFAYAGLVVISRVGQLCGSVWVWMGRACQGRAGQDRAGQGKNRTSNGQAVTQSSAICPSNDNLHASKTPGRLTQSALSLPQSQAYAVKSQEVISTGLGCVRSANIKKYIKRFTILLGDTLSTDPCISRK
jgi:hypothetical protein